MNGYQAQRLAGRLNRIFRGGRVRQQTEFAEGVCPECEGNIYFCGCDQPINAAYSFENEESFFSEKTHRSKRCYEWGGPSETVVITQDVKRDLGIKSLK